MLRGVVDVDYEVIVVFTPAYRDVVAPLKALGERYGPIHLLMRSEAASVTDAIRSGAEAARGEVVLVFAADEVGPVVHLKEMLALVDQGCTLVSCTRYVDGGRRLGGPMVARVLSRLANRAFRALTAFPLTDATTGLKMCRRDVLLSTQLEAQVGWACTFELAIKVHCAGGRMGEVPIVSIDRLFGGTPLFRLLPWIVEYSRWFVRGIAMCWRYHVRTVHSRRLSSRGSAGSPNER
jgi:dolichol-phosphate mannosyltransferase